jgi:hypothetical protein
MNVKCAQCGICFDAEEKASLSAFSYDDLLKIADGLEVEAVKIRAYANCQKSDPPQPEQRFRFFPS